MTLRESLGNDVRRVYEQVDALLDREDGLLMLFDGARMVSYTQGFGTAIEYRAGTEAAMLPTIGAVDRFADESTERRRLAAEQALDRVLADSFPASDPPSWNPGIVRPDPVVSRVERHVARDDASTADPFESEIGANTVVLFSQPITAERSLFHGVISFGGAIGIALLLPLSILAVGLPVALAVRGLLEFIGWVLGANLR